jgi:hypothetical protein
MPHAVASGYHHLLAAPLLHQEKIHLLENGLKVLKMAF